MIGFVLDQDAGPMPLDEGVSLEEMLETIGEYLASLGDHFPNIAETAEEIVGGDLDERFDYGLDVLIAGLEARAG